MDVVLKQTSGYIANYIFLTEYSSAHVAVSTFSEYTTTHASARAFCVTTFFCMNTKGYNILMDH